MVRRLQVLFAVLLVSSASFSAPEDETQERVQRIVFTLNIAAAEYAEGVAGGKVVAAQEYDEAVEFARQAFSQFGRASGERIDDLSRQSLEDRFSDLERLIASKASPGEVRAEVEGLKSALGAAFGVSTVVRPKSPPRPSKGEAVYLSRCAMCHGVAGDGKGPAAPGLAPKPFAFSDPEAMRRATPSAFWQVATVGVGGTAMVSWAESLSEQERWDAVAHLWSFVHSPEQAARGRELRAELEARLPAALADAAWWVERSDERAVEALRAAVPDLKPEEAGAIVASFRLDDPDGAAAPAPAPSDAGPSTGAVVERVRERLEEALALHAEGRPADAADVALEAYLVYEAVEPRVAAASPELGRRLEASFSRLRSLLSGGGRRDEIEAHSRSMLDDLSAASAPLKPSAWGLFVQSLTILLREGLEAILILAAIAGYLHRAGHSAKLRAVYAGAWSAVAASLATAWGFARLAGAAPIHPDALEGLTLLVAVVFLFYVSNWLLSKIEARRWRAFIEGRVEGALGAGSVAALSAVAFLAVYREGFETVLFYRALFGFAEGSALPIWTGMAAGASLLAVSYVAVRRLGLRVPMLRFFAATSALLFALAFAFAGQGVLELQEAGWVRSTPVPWAPTVAILGVYPFLETLAAQSLVALAMAATLVYVFAIEPERQRRRLLADTERLETSFKKLQGAARELGARRPVAVGAPAEAEAARAAELALQTRRAESEVLDFLKRLGARAWDPPGR